MEVAGCVVDGVDCCVVVGTTVEVEVCRDRVCLCVVDCVVIVDCVADVDCAVDVSCVVNAFCPQRGLRCRLRC